jgi:CheY-like chemotaxis protein
MADRHQHKILLVEDHDDLREAEAELLRLDGYLVDEAADGQRALNTMRTGPSPCLVLLDLEMPGMSGSQFRAAQLRDPRLATVPVVALSGDGGVAQQAEVMRMTGHLAKPPDLDALRGLVDGACRMAA